jgi:hypothetical protein
MEDKYSDNPLMRDKLKTAKEKNFYNPMKNLRATQKADKQKDEERSIQKVIEKKKELLKAEQ